MKNKNENRKPVPDKVKKGFRRYCTAVMAAAVLCCCTVPAFEQLTLTRFLDGGYFERHLSRMRKHYRAQLAALRAALAEPPFAEICAILRADAGLHFVLQFRTDLTDDALQAKLRAAGLNMPPLSGFYVGAPDAAALGRVVVNYADLEPEQFTAALRAALPALRDTKS